MQRSQLQLKQLHKSQTTRSLLRGNLHDVGFREIIAIYCNSFMCFYIYECFYIYKSYVPLFPTCVFEDIFFYYLILFFCYYLNWLLYLNYSYIYIYIYIYTHICKKNHAPWRRCRFAAKLGLQVCLKQICEWLELWCD